MLGLMVWSSVWIWTHLAQSEFNGSLSIVEIVNNLKIDFIWSNSYSLHFKESKSGDIRYLYAFKHVVVQQADSRFDHFKNKFLSQIKSQLKSLEFFFDSRLFLRRKGNISCTVLLQANSEHWWWIMLFYSSELIFLTEA